MGRHFGSSMVSYIGELDQFGDFPLGFTIAKITRLSKSGSGRRRKFGILEFAYLTKLDT